MKAENCGYGGLLTIERVVSREQYPLLEAGFSAV